MSEMDTTHINAATTTTIDDYFSHHRMRKEERVKSIIGGGQTMTSDETKEAINLIAEYAQTKMLCVDERQRQLLIKYNEIMGGMEQ